MKSFEFESWVQFAKGAFPNFDPTRGEIMREAWQRVLKNVSLDEAKNAITEYVVCKSNKFEPQPKDIAELLKVNKSLEVANEPIGEIKEDEPEVRFYQDVELGLARHNVYVYRLAYPKVLEGKDWAEALEEACFERFGMPAEFPSNKELEAKGINPHQKVDPSEVKALLDTFYKKGFSL